MNEKVDVFIYKDPKAENEYLVRPAVGSVGRSKHIWYHAIGCAVEITELPSHWKYQNGNEIGDRPIKVDSDTKIKICIVPPDPEPEYQVIPYKAWANEVEAKAGSDPIIIIHPPTN